MTASPNKLQTWRYKGPTASASLSIEVHTPKKLHPSLNQYDSNITPTRIDRRNDVDRSPNNGRAKNDGNSPFNGGRKNGSFRSPTFESNLFNNLSYPEMQGGRQQQIQNNYDSLNNSSNLKRSFNLTPKVGERENKLALENVKVPDFPNNNEFKSGPKSVSSTSSGTRVDDLVCNNCVNRELMEEHRIRKMKEDEHDKILKQIQDSNYRRAIMDEQKRAMENKERFKQEVNDMQLQKYLQKEQEREEAKKAGPMGRNSEDWLLEQQLRDASANTKSDLRRTLLEQMKAKEVSKLYDKYQDNGKAGLSLREEEDQYLRALMENKQNTGQELKSQIMLNEERKKHEKELERERNEKARKEKIEAEKKMQEQLIMEDLRKRNSLKNGILNQIQDRKLNEEAEKLNKLKYATMQKELQDQMEMMNVAEFMNKKNAEKDLENTLKSQIAAKKMQAELEKEREKAFRTAVCPHKCKLYACAICSRKYPRNFMSKRSVSPFRPQTSSKGGY